MTDHTGVEEAVERLTKAAADSGTVGGPFTWTVGVFAEDLRAILADRDKLLARIATLEERALTAAQYLCRLEGALLADNLDMKLNFPGEPSPTDAAETLVPGFDSFEYEGEIYIQSREGAE